jgi:hypothetical protein
MAAPLLQKMRLNGAEKDVRTASWHSCRPSANQLGRKRRFVKSASGEVCGFRQGAFTTLYHPMIFELIENTDDRRAGTPSPLRGARMKKARLFSPQANEPSFAIGKG